MFSKIVLTVVFLSSLSWTMSASMVQKASKSELGCIKGLGKKRVEALIRYRQHEQLSSLDELLKVKGIGKATIKNIKNDVKKRVCTTFNESSKKKKNKKKISAK